MSFPKTETEWAERASRHLKAELKRAGITYDGLANLLKKQGFRDETHRGLKSTFVRFGPIVDKRRGGWVVR
jgi:hypothetical protein